VLVIGDAALALADRGTYPHRYDLGEEWKRWTRQPFVFAVWAARRSAASASVSVAHKALLASRAWGLAHLDDLAVEASRKTRVPVAACREYLGGLDYAFSDQHRTALTDFLRRVGSLQFVQVA
jgi:chorismate dehydratase